MDLRVALNRVLLPITLVVLTSVLLMQGATAAIGASPPTTSANSTGQLASQGSSMTIASLPPLFRGHGSQSTNYDQQLGLTFTQDFSSMEYNVTAVEQVDPTLGTGPGYLLSGLSSSGYWYQVGLSWNWDPGFVPGTGFAISYEVFNPLGNSVFPANGGGGLLSFSGPVNPGDNVTLRLYFSSGQVVMSAKDTATGASGQVTFTAAGGTNFVGQPNGDATSIGFFTGLMTEWYHGEPYTANPAEVVYSTNSSVPSGWMWMDEFNANNGALVSAATGNSSSVTTFTNEPTQLQEFSYNGITVYSDAFEFITGVGSTTTTSSTSTTTGSTTTATTTATSTATTTSTTTSTETITVASTQTVTTTVSIPVSQTATTTATTTATITVTQPVTTTVTSTEPTTLTVTSAFTLPQSTTTTTQTTTQIQTTSTIPGWSYALMTFLLLAGLAVGYLLKRP